MRVGSHIAFVDFTRSGNVVNLIHTEVPAAIEGQGAGSALVRGTLELLRAGHYKVVPSCSFVRRYIERHPEHRDLIA
jgi:predicted GNAT family acetyltransferase